MMAAATPKAVAGQQAYTTAGSYTFTVPAGVTSISIVCIGGGCGGNGTDNPLFAPRAGSLAYRNNYTVAPGDNINVVVGAGGFGGIVYTSAATAGGDSSVASTVLAFGGNSATQTNVGAVSYTGGSSSGNSATGGAGGAGGYAGAGGNGGTANTTSSGSAGTGGSGGGGGCSSQTTTLDGNGDVITRTSYPPGGGGGVGLLGQGSNGAAGSGTTESAGEGGGGGSSGASGGTSNNMNGAAGGLYGGAGSAGGLYVYDYGNYADYYSGGNGGGGAVRIIWGAGRSYPSNAANV